MQIRQLKRRVGLMRERLDSVADAANQQRLETSSLRLLGLCSMRQNDLETLENQLPGAPSKDHWTNLDALRRRCDALAADCMALEQRVGLRDYPPAAAMCAAADALAEEFSSAVLHPRLHYSVVSDAEHYGADSSAIHLSYGRMDVWSLNRVVHEFGHLWAEEYASGAAGVQSAFVSSLGALWSEAQGKEFFADIMATFLTGPAYAFSCLLLDFNPARRASDTHPSDGERAYCILAALEQLLKAFQPITRPQVSQLIAELREYWTQAGQASGSSGPPANAIALDYSVELVCKRLAAEIPDARYRSLSGANQAKSELPSDPVKRPVNITGADILNGAWLARQASPDQQAEIGRTAVTMLAQPRTVKI